MNRRSREGCIDCKRAKVKCDEIQPSCGTCARRGHICQGYLPARQTAQTRKVQDSLKIEVDSRHRPSRHRPKHVKESRESKSSSVTTSISESESPSHSPAVSKSQAISSVAQSSIVDKHKLETTCSNPILYRRVQLIPAVRIERDLILHFPLLPSSTLRTMPHSI